MCIRDRSSHHSSFEATLEIKGIDSIGVLNTITRTISDDFNVNIIRLLIEAKDLSLIHIWKEKPAQRKPKLPEEFNLLKDHLSSFFNTKVQLVCNEKGKGKITIPFASEDELEKLIGLLDKLK